MSNRFKKMKRRGIRIRTLNGIMLVLAVATAIALFVAMQITTSIYNETHTVTQNLSKWRTSAYDLQVGSDYLTEQIRCFAAIGNRIYLDNYFEEAKVTKRRDKALRELESHHDYREALNALRQAMAESTNLMDREYYAAALTILAYDLDMSTFPEEIQEVEISAHDINLSVENKKQLAISLVFGDEYRKEKDMISKHMQECMDSLSTGMEQDQKDMAGKLELQVFVEHALTVLLIVLMLVIVILTHNLIVKPLRNAVGLIREEKDLPMEGAFEVRFLAKTYNLIQHTNMKNQEKLSYEATHDELTGLYNRRGYDFLMSNLDLDTSALILIDLDQFKEINDKYGHDIGDRILIKVSQAIVASFRTQDYICRLGGDELAVIMIHADPNLSSLIRKKFRLINENLNQREDRLPATTISAGVAFGEDGISIESLYKHADEALYDVKDSGRNDISFYKKDDAEVHWP